MQEAGTSRAVPPLSRRDRAIRLRRLLGRDAPSYAARANLTKQLDTLKREHCMLMNKVERCRRLRDDARQEQQKVVMEDVAVGLERLARRYENGYNDLRGINCRATSTIEGGCVVKVLFPLFHF